MQSLHNQLYMQNSYFNKMNLNMNQIIKISDTISVSDGLSENLKNVILENKSLGKKVEVYLTAIDRLTRNVLDVPFIKKYIDVIVVVGSENVLIYDVTKEWKTIQNFISSATKEIDRLKERVSSRMNCKRKRSNNSDLVSSAQVKSNTINNLLAKGYSDVDNDTINNIASMIILCQNIKSYDDWKKISDILHKYGNFSIMDDYLDIVHNPVYDHLSRNDIMYYVKKIFEKQSYNFDENIIKAFVNANINLGKKQKVLQNNGSN
ncbi:MAG: hypothetical protein EBQ92_00340, partial [Proteobacteria bacterium]|nr:hypothetical protein [Pseudomonadota bacterium]